MELAEKKSEELIRRRQQFRINDCKLEESRKRGTMAHANAEIGRKKPCFGSKSTGKFQFWNPPCLSKGYAPKPKVTTTVVTIRKPLSNVGKMTFNCKNKLVDSQHLEHNNKLKRFKPNTNFGSENAYGQKPNFDSNLRKMGLNVETNKLKRFEPKDLGKNRTYLVKPTCKVKYWDPLCSKENDAQKLNETVRVVSPKEQARREKIKEAMALFDQVYEKLCQDNGLKEYGETIDPSRVPFEAAKIVKQKLKWMDPVKTFGPICGVQVGDTFKFRAQLQMVGLHSQPQSGIDYIDINGKNLAISIVDSHRYSNESASCDTLSYCGHGGGILGNKSPLEDQRLERGNLALKNSMDEKTHVRVIRKEGNGKKEVNVYDGLYIVKSYKEERSVEGKIVFRFELERVPGQPPLHKRIIC